MDGQTASEVTIIDKSRPGPRPLKLVNGARRLFGMVAMRMGRIANPVPLSDDYGWKRGTPIDRLYIDQFLAAHASDIQGHVLEIGEDYYSRRFGGDRIRSQDVLHVHAGNPAATIVGDIADPSTLPEGRFDCIIMTQTLQLVFNLDAAIGNLRRALRPGGVALLTVSGITPICNDEWRDTFYWMFTPRVLRKLLNAHFDEQKVEVRGFGNLYAATAFLHGAAVQEVSKAKLDLQAAGPEYTVVVAARAVA
jgi:SAM-dependent methyltransferase